MTRTSTLVLGASILLLTAPVQAESSAYRTCYLTNAVPASGSTVPGNLPAISFFASTPYGSADGSTEPPVKLVRDLDQVVVPCSLENDLASSSVVLRPSVALEPGSYSVLYDCSGPYITNPGSKTVTTFHATASQAVPTSLGTLTHTVDYVAPRPDLTTCRELAANQRVNLDFQPSPDQAAFAAVMEMKLLVNNGLVMSWTGAARSPLVFEAVCNGAYGFRTGLNAVELRGRIVGTPSDLPPLSLQVAIACEQAMGDRPLPDCSPSSGSVPDGGSKLDAGAGALPRGGCSVAGSGAMHGMASLGLLLAFVARRRRRCLGGLLCVLLPVALAACTGNPDQPGQPEPDAGATSPSSGICQSPQYDTAKAAVYKATSETTCFAGSVGFLAGNVPQATMRVRYGNKSCSGLSLRACDDSSGTQAIFAAREQAVVSALAADLPPLTCSMEGIRLDGWSSNDIFAQTTALLAAADAAQIACSTGLRLTFDAAGRLVSLDGSDGSIPQAYLDEMLAIAGPTQLACFAGMVLCSRAE